MKRKLLIQWLFLFFLVGCGHLANLPSVCDHLEQSRLCVISQKYDVRLEDVGNILIVANAVAIGQGLYTVDDAIKVMKELRSVLNDPISYALFKAKVDESIRAYPGLIEVASIYFAELGGITDNMYLDDRNLLKGWLDKQILILERQS